MQKVDQKSETVTRIGRAWSFGHQNNTAFSFRNLKMLHKLCQVYSFGPEKKRKT